MHIEGKTKWGCISEVELNEDDRNNKTRFGFMVVNNDWNEFCKPTQQQGETFLKVGIISWLS